MPQNYGILAQAAPAAATDTILYTVPANTQIIVSFIQIANNDATITPAKIWARKAGEAYSLKQNLIPSPNVPGNDAIPVLHGATLGAGDIVMVWAGTSFVSFTMFGVRITP